MAQHGGPGRLHEATQRLGGASKARMSVFSVVTHITKYVLRHYCC